MGSLVGIGGAFDSSASSGRRTTNQPKRATDNPPVQSGAAKLEQRIERACLSLGRKPGRTDAGDRLGPELGPAVEHPLAAAGRRLQAKHQALGVFGIAVDNLGLEKPKARSLEIRPLPCRSAGNSPMGLAGPRRVSVPGAGFVGLAVGLVDPRVDDIGGEPGLLGSPGAVAEPRVFDGVINDPLFGGAARHQAGRPVRSPLLERFRVFIQKHERRGPHAVLDGIELRAIFPDSVRGPQLLSRLRRLASSFASEIVIVIDSSLSGPASLGEEGNVGKTTMTVRDTKDA